MVKLKSQKSPEEASCELTEVLCFCISYQLAQPSYELHSALFYAERAVIRYETVSKLIQEKIDALHKTTTLLLNQDFEARQILLKCVAGFEKEAKHPFVRASMRGDYVEAMKHHLTTFNYGRLGRFADRVQNLKGRTFTAKAFFGLLKEFYGVS